MLRVVVLVELAPTTTMFLLSVALAPPVEFPLTRPIVNVVWLWPLLFMVTVKFFGVTGVFGATCVFGVDVILAYASVRSTVFDPPGVMVVLPVVLLCLVALPSAVTLYVVHGTTSLTIYAPSVVAVIVA